MSLLFSHSKPSPNCPSLTPQILHSRIPFYYAEEATNSIRPMLGPLYHRDDRSFMGQLWYNFTHCKWVVPDPQVPGALIWAHTVQSTQ